MAPPEKSFSQATYNTPLPAVNGDSNKGVTGYQPNADQLARVAALRRFNRLYVYLPVGLITAVVLSLSLYLLYLALFPPSEDTYLFLSGLADFVLILMLVPVVLIFGLVMTAVIGGTIYYNYFMDEADKPLPPAPPYGRLRTLLWRIDNLLLVILPKLHQVTQRIAQPVIRFNGWFDYVQSWLNSLQMWLFRFTGIDKKK